MPSRTRIAGIIAILALLVPLFIGMSYGGYQSGRRVYVVWSVFEYSYYSQLPALSFFTQWALIDTVLSGLCFVSLAAGAALLLVKPDLGKLGASMVFSGAVVSVIDIVYNLFFPSPASLTIIPVGLFLAFGAAFIGFKAPSTVEAKATPRRIVALVPIALITLSSVVILLGSTPLDMSIQNPPEFCTSDFVELDKIGGVTRFRSLEGHDYSDSYEQNLSMKNYYIPKPEYGNSSKLVGVFSPVDGSIIGVFPEGDGRGYQVHIRVAQHPDYSVVLFHVNIFSNVVVGGTITAGELLGYADVRGSISFDIAVWRHVGVFRDKLYSYFDVVTDDVFSLYQSRGIADRATLINSVEQARVFSQTYFWNHPNPGDRVALSP